MSILFCSIKCQSVLFEVVHPVTFRRNGQRMYGDGAYGVIFDVNLWMTSLVEASYVVSFHRPIASGHVIDVPVLDLSPVVRHHVLKVVLVSFAKVFVANKRSRESNGQEWGLMQHVVQV